MLACDTTAAPATAHNIFPRQKKKQKKKKKEKGMPISQRSVGRLSRFAQKKYSLKQSGKGRFFLKATRRA
jgi:hypothetical protein